MAESTRENGKQIKCTGRVLSPSQTVDTIRVSIEMTRKTERGFTSGQMDEGTRVNSTKENNTALVLLFLRTERGDRQSLRMESE
jgi:hypothetical protein